MFHRLAKPDEREKLKETEVTYLPTTDYYIVAHGDHATIPIEERPLPSHIFLNGGRVMVRRSKPVCLDMPSHDTNHATMYATLLMHRPWMVEADFLGDAAISEERCQAMWDTEHDNCLQTSDELKRMLQLSLLS